MTSSVTGDSLTTQKEISDEQKKFLTEVLTYYQEFAGEKADDEPSRARTAARGFSGRPHRVPPGPNGGSGGSLPPGPRRVRDAGRRVPRRADVPRASGHQPQQPGDSAHRPGEATGGGGAVSEGPGDREKLVAEFPAAPAVPPGAWPTATTTWGFCWPAWGSGRRRRSSIGKPWRSRRSWSPTSPPCRSTARPWPTATTTWELCWLRWGSGRRRRSSIGKRWRFGRSWSPCLPPCRNTARDWPTATTTWATSDRPGEAAGGGGAVSESPGDRGEAGRRVPRRAGAPQGPGRQPQQPGNSAG